MRRFLSFCFLYLLTLTVAGQTAPSYQYWIDTIDDMHQGVLSGDVFKSDIDFSSYKNGAHVLTFRVDDGKGNWSAPRSWIVYKSQVGESATVNNIEYWIDDISKRTTAAVADGLFAAEIDVAGISDGFHTLTYRVVDNVGRRSAPQSSIIMKCPPFSEKFITAYQYWFNGSDRINTVKLDNPKNPYELTTVIPFIGVEQPAKDEVYIGTTQEGASRLLYLNRLYTRFCDTSGSWSTVRIDTFGIDIDKGVVNLASLITNPDATEDRIGWNVEGTVGNLIQKTEHYSGTDIPYFSLGNITRNWWNASMSQTIEGLPAGSYIVSVSARGASGVDMKLYANDEYVELPAIGAEGGEIWQDAPQDSPEKLCNDSKGRGWSRRSVLVSTDGGPLTIKAVAVAERDGMWADFVDFGLKTNGAASLKVAYSDSVNPDSYKNMKLVLKSEHSRMQLITTSAREYSFAGLSATETYSLVLENAYGQQLWCCKNFTPESCDYSLTMDNVSMLRDVTLNVMTPDGLDVSESVDVVWHNALGEYIGEGITIGGMADGNEIVCDVALGDSLGVIYSEPESMCIQVSEKSANTKSILSYLPSGTLTGKVYAGKWPAANATVSVSQNINGRYVLTSRVKTDEDGCFMLQLPIDSCRVSIAMSGYFVKNLIVPSPGELDKIELEPIHGDIVSLRLRKLSRTFSQIPADTVEWIGGTRNIVFSLRNITQGIDSMDFVVQGNSLIVNEGLTPGDRIEISARSLKDEFTSVSCTTVVTEDGSADALLTFVEHGGISLTIAGSGNQETRAILFDASGRYVDNQVLSFTGNVEFAPLKSGNYSLVVMGHSDLLGNVSSISTIDDAALSIDEDYLYVDVSVKDGCIEPVSLGVVPKLNEAPFYFTSENASFSVNKAHTVAGSFVTYTAKIEFKEIHVNDVSDVSLVIDIPEGCSYVPGSAIVGSASAVTSEYDGKLIIHLDDSNYRDRIRFCLVALQGGRYLTHATLNFDCDGRKSQPLGRLEVIADDMGINVPSITNVPEITVSGMCQPNASVYVYDGNVEIASVRAKYDGSWSHVCRINHPYNMSVHNIHAEIETGFGALLTTVTEKVEYNINANRVQSVTMINTAHGPLSLKPKEYVTKFDFISPSQEEKVYWFWPKYPTFTFIVDFLENNPNRVENVYVKVHTSSGDTKVLKAEYSERKNRWIATGDFNSFSMPRNVSVAYDKKNEISLYDQREGEDMILSADDYFAGKIAEEKELSTIMVDIDKWFESADKDIEGLKSILRKYNIYDESSSMDVELPDDIAVMIDDFFTSKADVMNGYTKLDSIVSIYTPIISEMSELSENYYQIKKYGGILDLGNGVYYEVDKNRTYSFEELKNDGYESINTVSGELNFIKYGNGYNTLYSQDEETLHKVFWTPSDSYIDNSDFEVQMNFVKSKINELENMCVMIQNENQDALCQYQQEIELKENVEKSLWRQLFDNYETFEDNTGWWRETTKQLIKEKWNNVYYRKTIYNIELGELVNKSWSIYNDVNERFSAFSDYDNYYNKYKDCFSPEEQFLVKTEIMGAKALEVSLVALKTAGIDKLERFLKGGNGVARYFSAAFKEYGIGYITALIDKASNGLIRKTHDVALGLLQDIAQGCEPKEPEEPSNEEHSCDNNSMDVQDPSGYVYEAVTSNRLSGVTATVFELQKEADIYGDVSEKAVAWDAERYSQRNPLITDEMGMYAWDVPQGQWQVRFSKPGYEPVATEWLPVPPPQLDINVGMHQAVNPHVEKVVGYETGITVTFDKYMKPETFVDNSFTVKRADEDVKGTYEFVNLELAPGTDKQLASKIKFVPEKPFSVGETVTVNVAAGALSYADMPLLDNFTTTVVIQSEISTILTDSLITVPLGSNGNLDITVLPAVAAAGRMLTVTNGSPSIATISDERIVLDSKGHASIGIKGDLPGTARLMLAVDGCEILTEVAARVEWVVDKVGRPVASIISGSHVNIGTPLALKCSTEGASIYYTIDGSSPADSNNKSRKLYTTPIIIDRDMTLKAIAEKDDVASSDVVEFIYYIGPMGISGVVGKSPNVMTDNGDILVLQCNGCSCDVYDMSGIKVWAGKSLMGDVRISLSGGPLFIVRVQNPDGSVTVNTVGI